MVSTKTNSNTNTMPATKTAPKRSAKAEVTVPVVSTPAPAPTPAPVESAPVAETVAPATTQSADAILASIQTQLRALTTDVSSRVRDLLHQTTEATRALRREARDSKRRRRVDPATLTPEQRAAWEARRANNAFLKLRPISDELASFMGLPAKSQRSQTDVTKFVSNYVKTHNCFDPNFKRRIIPDAKLSKLLRVRDGQEVTYLNLQSFLKVHFIKA
jgi:chromatin remodeling complex protein RSC6